MSEIIIWAFAHTEKGFFIPSVKRSSAATSPCWFLWWLLLQQCSTSVRTQWSHCAEPCTCTGWQDLILLASSLSVKPLLIYTLKHKSLFCFHTLFLPATFCCFIAAYCSFFWRMYLMLWFIHNASVRVMTFLSANMIKHALAILRSLHQLLVACLIKKYKTKFKWMWCMNSFLLCCWTKG